MGRGLPDRRGAGRARGSRAARRVSPDSRSRVRTAAAYVEIDTTRPELIPGVRGARRASGRRALPAAVRHDVAHAAVRRARAGAGRTRWPIPRRARGIAMICTFGDLTDVTWWRELALPVRAIIQPNGALRPVTWGIAGLGVARTRPRRRQHYDELAGLSAVKARARDRRAAARERRSARRAAADHPSREVLREGRPAARDRHEPPVVHQDDGHSARRCSRAAASCSGIPAYMRTRYENWVNGLNGDWCVSRQRFFGVPFPVWYPVRDDGSDRLRRAAAAGRIAAADRSVDRRARRLHARSSAASRAASSAIPTSWTPGRRRRSRRTSSAAGETIRICSARTFPMDLRPQAHDIIRTWLFSTGAALASRARLAAVDARGDLRLGARSRSQEDVEVEGQRRHADGAARGARLRRRALLGGEGRAGRRHGVRRRAR